MFNIVGFYNSYGSGDIFESREFIRDVMRLLPARKYVYYTGKSSRLLMDIRDLEVVSTGVPAVLDSMKPFVHDTVHGNLFFNTWIGRDSGYVLPGIGCTVEGLHDMWNDMLRPFSVQLSEDIPLEYLTSYNYSKYDIVGINEYMDSIVGTKKVYISNGDVHSLQADNFDMTPMIIELARRFSTVRFFVTADKANLPTIGNIVNANSLIPNHLDSNLPELSYLSRWCGVTIGRNSGPHVFSWVKGNCLRVMANITFSHTLTGSHFVQSTIPQKKYWAGGNDVPQLTKWAGDVLERVL